MTFSRDEYLSRSKPWVVYFPSTKTRINPAVVKSAMPEKTLRQGMTQRPRASESKRAFGNACRRIPDTSSFGEPKKETNDTSMEASRRREE